MYWSSIYCLCVGLIYYFNLCPSFYPCVYTVSGKTRRRGRKKTGIPSTYAVARNMKSLTLYGCLIGFMMSLSVCPSVYIYMFAWLYACLSVCLSVHPSIYQFVCLSVCLSIYLSAYLPVLCSPLCLLYPGTYTHAAYIMVNFERVGVRNELWVSCWEERRCSKSAVVWACLRSLWIWSRIHRIPRRLFSRAPTTPLRYRRHLSPVYSLIHWKNVRAIALAMSAPKILINNIIGSNWGKKRKKRDRIGDREG